MPSSTDQHFTRNATGVAIVEFFWGLGFPVVMESTFLQIFLKNLGASDTLIGLVPGILMAGISLCPLCSAYLTRNLGRTMPIVLGMHLVSALVLLLFGSGLLFLEDPAHILPAFFGAYVLFSMSIGFTLPVWLNYLVKIFSAEKNVKGLAIMYMAQNAAKILASFFILKVVSVYRFSLVSSAWIFIGAGLLFLVGSFGFLITREEAAAPTPDRDAPGLVSHLRETASRILGNRNMVYYLLGDLDTYVVITIMGFYANYATEFFQVSQAVAAGLFVTLIYSGAITANVTMGTLGWLSLRKKYLSTKGLTTLLLILLILCPGLPAFLLVSFLLGFCRGTRNIIYSPLVKRLSGKEDATAYFAVAPLFTIWFTSGFPLFFGAMLDHFHDLGDGAYRLMFTLSLGVVLLTFWVGQKSRFGENRARG